MPTTPYAKLLVSVNGGAPQSGVVTVTHGDTIAFTAESTAQWPTDTPTRWVFTMYPFDLTDTGWSGPGTAGWTTESVTVEGGGTFDVYVYLGIGPPTPFTMPALPFWGDYYLSLVVNGGQINGIVRVELTDNTTMLRIVGPNGLHDVPPRADTRVNSARSYGADMSHNFRVLDAALVGAATQYALVPEAIEIGAGSAGAITQYSPGDHVHPFVPGVPTTITVGAVTAAGGGTAPAGAAHVHALPAPAVVAGVDATAGSLGISTAVAREDHAHQVVTGSPVDVGTANSAGVANNLVRADHVHALTFPVVNSVLATANAPITVNGQTLTSGGFVGPYFSTDAADPAQSGLLRAANNTTAVAFRNAGLAADIPALSCDGSDQVIVGDATNTQNVVIQTAANTFVHLKADTAFMFSAFPTVCSFFSASPFDGGGNKVVEICNATTEPTGGQSGSTWVWAFDGALRSQSQDFVKNTVVAKLENVVSANEDLRAKDRKKTRVSTPDATTVTAISYALPESCTVDFVATVIAYGVDGPLRSRWRIEGGAGRLAAGGASIMGTNDTSQKSDAGAAGWTAVVDANANDLRVRLTGPATTVNWFVLFEVMLMDPA